MTDRNNKRLHQDQAASNHPHPEPTAAPSKEPPDSDAWPGIQEEPRALSSTHAKGAQGKTDQVRQKANHAAGQIARKMNQAASQVRERGETVPGGQRTAHYANALAEKMESTAAYIGEYSVSQMTGDLEDLIRQRPRGALIGAAAAGFLIGRIIRG